MDYNEALAYLIERSEYDRGFISNPFAGDEAAALGLRRTRAILEELGNPDRTYRTIHVAGTKGKGSTCAMIEAITRAAGLKTGLYTSPHLHTFRERIQLAGEPVSETTFAALTERAAAAVERVTENLPEIGRPTAFEISTAMALDAFASGNVDVGIVEVGLGGRLDATNVVNADVSVITNISLDHQSILGETLEEIASEKAGIIKPGGTTVVGPQAPGIASLIEKIALDRDNRTLIAGRDWTTYWSAETLAISGPWQTLEDVELGLAGVHQGDNAGVAVMACFALNPDLVNPSHVRDALATVRWPGRFEQVAERPDIIVDGAHNVESINALVTTTKDRYPGKRPTVILGSSRDKDTAGMLRGLATIASRIILTRSTSPRAADPELVLGQPGLPAADLAVGGSVGTSLDDAIRHATEDDLIIVTGSLYVVAEAREALDLAETPVQERNLL